MALYPTLSIVMLVHNRPRLTQQALESLVCNTRGTFGLTIVDDMSDTATQEVLEHESRQIGALLCRPQQHLGPGQARNWGIELSSRVHGRGDLLYLTDNDCFFRQGWDQVLLQCWESVRRRFKGPLALGGYDHPYHLRGRVLGHSGAIAGHSVRQVEALGLLSWLWEWESWDRFGPFEPSPCINGGEDVTMGKKIVAAGGWLGVVEPQVVLNCGITSSDGRPCPGAGLVGEQDFPEGTIVE